MMHPLPEDWKRAAFNDVISDVTGGNPKVPAGRLQPEGAFPVVDQGKDFIAGYSDNAGDLCGAELPVIVFGDHTRSFKFVDFPFCVGADGTKVLRPASGDHARYLYHFLRQLRLPEAGYSRHFKYLKVCEIVLAPPPEQQRIAEVLDGAEALLTQRRAALLGLDEFITASFLEMFGDPVRNTRNWPTASLGDLGIWRSGGTPPRGEAKYFSGNIPWFSSGELNDMYAYKSAECISESAVRESSAKLVEQESLMLGMYDTAALKASIAGVRCACNQAIAFAALDRALAETVFVYYAITIGRDQFRRLQRGVRQKNLNLSMIREIRIPLPPVASQRAFTRCVSALETVRRAQRASLAEMDFLSTSLQHRAFRGEL
jgi:type I restriction enzyme S subunit